MALQLEVAVLARKNVDLLPRDVLHAAMKRATQRATNVVLRRTQPNLTGRFLKVDTGRLRQSVTAEVRTLPNGYEGIVGTNVWYGKLHEFGGTFTYTRTIKGAFRRTQSGAFRFTKVGGRHRVIAQIIPRVTTVTATFRERPWLRTALSESRHDIERFFDEEIAKAIAAQATA